MISTGKGRMKRTRRLFGGINELRKAANKRLTDAHVLVKSNRWRGAMYLAGYAVECWLKSRLMEQYAVRHLDQLEAKIRKAAGASGLPLHDLGMLKRLARVSSGHDPRLRAAFDTCEQWTTSWRYDPQDGDRKTCERFMEAVQDVRGRIDDRR
jgi:hypothetical protein